MMLRLIKNLVVLVNLCQLVIVLQVSGDTLGEVDEHIGRTLKRDAKSLEVINEAINWTKSRLHERPFLCFNRYTPALLKDDLEELFGLVESKSCDLESTDEVRRITNLLTGKGSRLSRPLGMAVATYNTDYLNNCVLIYGQLVDNAYENLDSRAKLDLFIKTIAEQSDICSMVNNRDGQRIDRELWQYECLEKKHGSIGQYANGFDKLLQDSLDEKRYNVLFDKSNGKSLLETSFTGKVNDCIENPCIEFKTKIVHLFQQLKTLVKLTGGNYPPKVAIVRTKMESIKNQCDYLDSVGFKRLIDELTRLKMNILH